MLQAPSTRDEAREVPLGQIEATLAQLGRETSLHNGGQMAARSSVMTLVAYANGAEQGARVGRAIEGLTGQHPSRSIILMADPDEPTAPLTASVSMHCHVPHFGAGQTCSEQIKVHACGETAHHLAGVVLPLLLTELPVFVWWTDGLHSVGDLMENLVDISDRVMVDSADFSEPRPDFLRMAELMQRGANRVAFSDFNWSRVRPWRELVAQFFDAPRLRPYLDGVQRVEIEYAVAQGERPNPAQANLFAGWLASRLRWQALTAMHTLSGASTVGLRTSLGAPVTMEIEPRFGVTTRDWWAMSSAEWPMLAREGEVECVDFDAEGNPVVEPCVGVGALMRVSLQARLNGKSATFTVVREDDLRNATTVVVAEGESMPQRRTPLTPLSETSLLHAQLGQFGRDPVFDAAVQAAHPLVQPSPTKGRMKR